MNVLAGARDLTKLAARRDRLMLPVWIYVLTALLAGTAYSFRTLYPTAAARIEFATTVGHNPALLAFYGPLYGDSLGSLTAWRYGALSALGAGLMSIFIVVRHTRGDEETGRLELIGSAAVGRQAALASAVCIAVLANVGLTVLVAVVLVALGLPAAGSISLACAIGCCGLAFTAVAALSAQVAQTARSARGIAIAVLGVCYLLRAVGDSAGASGPSWLSWLSPIGWAEVIRSFGAIRWWVLALPVATAAAAGFIAARLAVSRDYDAGLLPDRPGPAVAAGWLRSPLALAWRLHRGALIGWTGGGLVYGIVVGAAAKGIGGLLSSNSIKRIVTELGGQAAITDAYLAAIMSFTGLIAAGYAVSVVLRLRSEETTEHADAVLATGTGRISWALSHLAVAVVGTVLILTVTGAGAGIGLTLRSVGHTDFGQLAIAGLVQAPAALVIAGVAVALFGLAPKASVAGSWSVLGAAVLLLLLGAALQLSHWALDASPFTHSPKLPGGMVAVAPLVWLCVIALGLGVAGLAGLRHRDIG